VETAAAAPAVLLPRLRKLRSLEEIHCGAVEGLPLERVQAEYADLWARNLLQEDDDFCWPGGESYAALRRRVLRAVRAIARLHRGERVVVVTHAGVISQILGWIHGRNAARWEEFRPGNASITQVISDGSSWVVESFNDRSHLR
jgi:broad specificity phosphatase PhoE